eukprot:4893249-Pyramimonas_sp.AAC.1
MTTPALERCTSHYRCTSSSQFTEVRRVGVKQRNYSTTLRWLKVLLRACRLCRALTCVAGRPRSATGGLEGV